MTKKLSRIAVRTVIFAMLLIALPGTAHADGGSGGYEANADGYHVTLVFSEPVKTGLNEFHVLIVDPLGMPVSKALVEVAAMPSEEMPNHEAESTDDMHGMEMATETPPSDDVHGMSGMDMSISGKTETNSHEEVVSPEEEPVTVMLAEGHESGEYSGEIHFDASGDWTFNIHFTVNDQMMEVEFPIEVPRSFSKYGILAGFIGINATVISAAAITKRKSISPKA